MLGPSIPPDCLQLSLACDACDDTTADLVVDALLSYFPRLCNCEIRLGSSGHYSGRYEGSLGQKAREAALGYKQLADGQSHEGPSTPLCRSIPS